ncbi:MAG: cyclopropane-fatty-acyl-phospholipid synthase family protein [Candidatus Thiodiazotropha sp. (ex. Lucinisca nassula)]|nr:cyclopropane-fatty-acyl-phospholipid synthase family protein [Candidatus Thiodiazotropha sp. (ex. Lucinisca nassula)]
MSTLQTQSLERFNLYKGVLDDFLSRLDCLEQGTLEIETNGRLFILNGRVPGNTARINIRSFAAFIKRIYTKGDIGFAESYMAEEWDTPDLTTLLVLLGENRHRFTRLRRASRLSNLANRIHHWSNRNTREGSSRNIEAHYDLGNAFYRLWLDAGMTYSCGLFDSEHDSLEQAQQRKYERILDLIQPQVGASVLEIGCGWGGFAEMAASKQLNVDGVSLSPAQLEWANRRIQHKGLNDTVELKLTDYRDLSGQYDHIVSIEMFEAVGEAYWDEYFSKLNTLLKAEGTAALQVITIDEEAYESYQKKPDFIQRYIFPGGMLPPASRLKSLAEHHGFKLDEDDCFGLDYAKTLEKWQINFNQVKEQVLSQGFDPQFIRMWQYYLSYCEAGFLIKRLNLHQILLRKASY